jgi:cytochrome c peroxidase
MCPDHVQQFQFNYPSFFKKTNIKANIKRSILFIALSILLAACNDNQPPVFVVIPPSASALDEDIRAIIASKNLTGDPSKGKILPNIEDPKAQLGMKLFFSKSLSGERDSACVSCHHPMLGGGDDLVLPIGVDAQIFDLLGPGRIHSISGEHYDGGPTVPRNSPTTFNIALWDNFMFHDGRIESLGKTPNMGGNDGLGIRTPDVPIGEVDNDAGQNLVVAQARFPVTSKEEMKNFSTFEDITNTEVRDNLEQRLGDYGNPLGGMLMVNYWLAEFQYAFSAPDASAEELVTFNNIADAIGEYERSQVFVDTPWKKYVEGDDSVISEIAKRGAKLFLSTGQDGGANCSSCHSGDFFTDESFHVIGMVQIGRGKGDGDFGTEDFGRFRETKDEKDKYAFRTPSLLNVTATGPWGHAGGSATLEQAIRTHLNPQKVLNNYDISQLDPNIQAVDMVINTQRSIDKLLANRAAGIASIEDISLSDTQVAELLAFIEVLTDSCVEDTQCLRQWIPDASDTNPDTLRINAIDGDGNYL